MEDLSAAVDVEEEVLAFVDLRLAFGGPAAEIAGAGKELHQVEERRRRGQSLPHFLGIVRPRGRGQRGEENEGG